MAVLKYYDRSVALFWIMVVLAGVACLGGFFVYSSVQTHKEMKRAKSDHLFLKESLWTIEQNIPLIDNLFNSRIEYSKKQSKLNEIRSYEDNFKDEESTLINKENDLIHAVKSVENKIKDLESDPYRTNPQSMLSNLPNGVNSRDIEIAKYLK